MFSGIGDTIRGGDYLPPIKEEGTLKIEISLNDNLVTTPDHEPFQYELPLVGYEPGEYTLGAKATVKAACLIPMPFSFYFNYPYSENPVG